MARKSDKSMIVGLDIGTSKVVAIVGEVTDAGQIEIIGIGQHPSRGMKKGVVVNIESTVQSIQRAVEEAELMAGCEIHSVYAGIAGSHIKSLNSHGIVAIKDREVTASDVDRVIDAARAVAIPADQRVLHILPQEFVIDQQEGIREPIGMSGVRLEAKVHLVTGSVSAAQNIIKCVRRCGLEVQDLILQPLASSLSALTPDEKELGVALVDIGGGTTDIAVVALGGMVYDQSVRTAGHHMDEAIIQFMRRRHGLLIGERTAEQVKIEIGSACEDVESLSMEVRGRCLREGRPRVVRVTDEEIRGALAEPLKAIVAAVREALDVIPPEISADVSDNGFVVTGGGALLRGIAERLRRETGVPVTIADEPLTTVARGVGMMLDDIGLLKRVASAA